MAMFHESNRPFSDRREAGVELASKLRQYAGRNDVVVLALPRGGVPVAFEVAKSLHAPLDIFLVRKLGMPGHPESTMEKHQIRRVPVVDKRLLCGHHLAAGCRVVRATSRSLESWARGISRHGPRVPVRLKRQVRLRERRRSRRVELLPLEELYCALVLFSSRTAAEGAEIPAATCLRILFP